MRCVRSWLWARAHLSEATTAEESAKARPQTRRPCLLPRLRRRFQRQRFRCGRPYGQAQRPCPPATRTSGRSCTPTSYSCRSTSKTTPTRPGSCSSSAPWKPSATRTSEPAPPLAGTSRRAVPYLTKITTNRSLRGLRESRSCQMSGPGSWNCRSALVYGRRPCLSVASAVLRRWRHGRIADRRGHLHDH